jgi:hypothetical protein
MVFHVILFRPRAGLERAAVDEFLAAIARAQQLIPSIRRFQVGRRVTHGSGYEAVMSEDFRYAAVLEFDDLAGLKGYLTHPAHDALGEGLWKVMDAVLVYDYEMLDAADAARLGADITEPPA